MEALILILLPISCPYVVAFFIFLIIGDKQKRGIGSICIWLTIFLCCVFVFFPWNMFITPGGAMKSIKPLNIFASSLYLFCWFLLSLWAGVKNRYEVLIAALAYSSVPIIGVFLLKAKIMYAIGMWFYWSIPIQGLSFMKTEFIDAIMVIQPLLFIGGYKMSKAFRKQENTRNITE